MVKQVERVMLEDKKDENKIEQVVNKLTTIVESEDNDSEDEEATK